MSIHTHACIAASFLVLAAPAAAESEAVRACFDLPSNTEQRQCAEELYRAASAKLDEALLGAIARASKAEGTLSLATAIRNSQNLWQAYRDAECRGVVGYDSRPSTPWVSACLAEKTLQRIRELEGG
jgi:uncharacterized protein YecT (DUF1311 family)